MNWRSTRQIPPSGQYFPNYWVWNQARPGIGALDRAKLSARFTAHSMLGWEIGSNLFGTDYGQEELELNDPRMREILTPNQISEEFPYIERVAKSPMRRGEAHYYNERDRWFKDMGMALGSHNTSMIPSIVSQFAGGLPGAMADPLVWLTGLGSVLFTYKAVGLLTSATRMHQLMGWYQRARVAGTTTGRLTMGSANALDGMIGEAGYSALHAWYRTSHLNRDYSWNEFFSQVALGGALGAVLGAAFPKRMSPDFAHLYVRDFIKNESGAIDLGRVGELFAGENVPTVRGSVELKNRRVAPISINPRTGVEMNRLAMERAGLKPDFIQGALGLTGEGVTRLGNLSLSPTLGEGKSIKILANRRPVEGLDTGGEYFRPRTIYIPVGVSDTRGFLKTPSILAGLTPEWAAKIGFWAGLDSNGQIGVVALDVGEKSNIFFKKDLEPEQVEHKFHPVFSELRVREPTSLEDGRITAGPGNRVFNESTAILRPSGLKKVEGVLDQVYVYGRGGEGLDSKGFKHFVSSVLGREGRLKPMGVRNIGEEFKKVLADDKKVRDHYESAIMKYGRFSPLYQKRAGPVSQVITDGVSLAFNRNKADVGDLKVLQDLRAKGVNLLAKYGADTGLRPSDFERATLGEIFGAVYDKVGLEGVEDLYQGLRERGHRFHTDLDLDTPLNQMYFMGDRILIPDTKARTIQDAIFDEEWMAANSSLPLQLVGGKTLRLDIHPSTMDIIEGAVGAHAAAADGGSTVLRIFENQTVFAKSVYGEVLKLPVQQRLRQLGYTSWTMRTASGGLLSGELAGSGAPGRMTVGDFRRLYDELDAELGRKPEGETQTPAKEEKETTIYLKNVFYQAGGGEEGFYNRLLRKLEITARNEYLVKEMGDKLRDAFEKRARQEVGTPEFLDADIKVKNLQNAIESAFKLMKYVQEGAFSGKRLPVVQSSGEELLEMMKTHHHNSYRALGGENIETSHRSMMNHLLTSFLAQAEQEVGVDVVGRFVKGHLDEDILKIHYQRQANIEKNKGSVAKGSEQVGEGVSEAAIKIEGILKNVMDASDRFVTDAGFSRMVRPPHIGGRAFSRTMFLREGFDTFKDDFIAAIDPSQRWSAKQYWDEVVEPRIRPRSKMEGLAEIPTETGEKWKFKGAAEEYSFMSKYGKVAEQKLKIRGKEISFLDNAASNVFHGFIAQVNVDARSAAVARHFGTMPFFSLDLALDSLSRKVDEQKGLSPAWVTESKAALSRTHHFAESMLNSWVYGDHLGIGFAPMMTSVLKSAAVAELLGRLVLTAGAGDMISSILTHQKTMEMLGKGKHGPLGYAKGIADVMGGFFKAKSKKSRMEIGRAMDTLITSDTREYFQRFEGTAAGVASWASNMAMRMGMAPLVTDMGRTSGALLSGSWFRLMLKNSWADTPVEGRAFLERYGITESIWPYLQSINDRVSYRHGGIDFFSIADSRAALRQAIPDEQFADKIHLSVSAMFQDMDLRKVVQSSRYFRKMFQADRDNPESNHRMISEMMTMFKPIMREVWERNRQVAHMGSGKGNPGVGYLNFWHGFGKMLPVILTVGIFHKMFRDLAKGRVPYVPVEDDQEMIKWMSEVMLLSGVLGLVGDAVLGRASDSEAKWSNLFVGPILGDMGYAVAGFPKAAASAAWEGDSGEILKAMRNLVGPFTPDPSWHFGTQAITNTAFLESLGDYSQFFYTSDEIRARKAAMRRRGQEYIGE